MGWVIADACSRSQKQNTLNYLLIELSKYNTNGEQAVSSFLQYLKTKNINLNISVQKNENQNNLITMKYYRSSGSKIIFEGNELEQKFFDSLYNQLL